MSPLSLLLLAFPPTPLHVAPPQPAALRARALAHEAAGQSATAGDIFLELADLSEVDRVDALDRARKNYDAAYLTTHAPQYLCWALGAAERAVRTGKFATDQEALSWRDNAEEDLARLQDDAQTTHRANCRFDADGLVRRPRMLPLLDADFVAPAPPPAPPLPPPPPPDRRRQTRLAVGTIFLGLGAGSLTFMAVALARGQARESDARELRGFARGEDRHFTPTEQIRFDNLLAAVSTDRLLALGGGIAAALTTATAIAILVHRPRRGPRLRARLVPQWRGAALHLEF